MLDRDVALDGVFRALADPTRRAMLDRLSRSPAAVTELAAPLSMSLAAVLQHLQVLEQSGLVRTEKRGRVRTCRIDSAAFALAERWISERRTLWERRLDRLEELLSESPEPSEPRPDAKRGRKKKP